MKCSYFEDNFQNILKQHYQYYVEIPVDICNFTFFCILQRAIPVIHYNLDLSRRQSGVKTSLYSLWLLTPVLRSSLMTMGFPVLSTLLISPKCTSVRENKALCWIFNNVPLARDKCHHFFQICLKLAQKGASDGCPCLFFLKYDFRIMWSISFVICFERMNVRLTDDVGNLLVRYNDNPCELSKLAITVDCAASGTVYSGQITGRWHMPVPKQFSSPLS